MMRAAVEAAASVHPKPRLLAVTVLTSLDAADLAVMGVSGTPLEQVVRLAKLTKEIRNRWRRLQPTGDRGGASGVWAGFFDRHAGRSPCRRFARRSAPGDDAPPCARSGSDLLVIGRPITGAPDPAEAAKSILADLRAT